MIPAKCERCNRVTPLLVAWWQAKDGKFVFIVRVCLTCSGEIQKGLRKAGRNE